MKKILLYLWLLAPCLLASQSDMKKTVLLLHSYHQGYDWTDNITRGVKSVLNSEDSVHLYIEHMDMKRIWDDNREYIDQFSQLISQKYSNVSLDLILVTDNYALELVSAHREALFQDIPVVFCGIEQIDPKSVAGMTGILEDLPIKENIDLILKIHPNTRKIYFINDRSMTGSRFETAFNSALEAYPDLEYETLNQMTPRGILKYLEIAGSNTVILMGIYSRDYNQKIYGHHDILEKLASTLNAPIYGMHRFYLGHGIVGGYVNSGFTHGQISANIAKKILDGESIDNIPILTESPKQYVFDHTLIKTHGIPKDLLPRGSLMINEPSSIGTFVKQHTAIVVLSILLFIAMSTAITVLFRANITKKRHSCELEAAKEELEKLVQERTEELEKTNLALEENVQHLVQTIHELNVKEEQIHENEIKAQLGDLVAGMTHEVNTPLGISTTAITHLGDELKDFKKAKDENAIKKSTLNSFVDSCEQTVKIISGNLERAAALIQSFKHVAVDQCSEESRQFSIKHYLEEILLSLRPKLKNTKHNVVIEVPQQIEVYNYPGAFSQIMTNLIMNSLIHGFEGVKEGTITVTAKEEGSSLVLLYSDNGKGIPEAIQHKVFDRYFTTKRGKGGSGLGLCIIKDIVEKQMKGTLSLKSSEGAGTQFTITIPKKVSNHENT